MTQQPSRFIWYELLTSDADAASVFYSKVVGWTEKDSGMPGYHYRMLGTGDGMVGGLMAVPDDAAAAGMRPSWFGYISVPNVDKAIVEITGAGGNPIIPATDIPNVGRFAMLTDPQGALFYIMTPIGDGRKHLVLAGQDRALRLERIACGRRARGARFLTASNSAGASPKKWIWGPMGKYILFKHRRGRGRRHADQTIPRHRRTGCIISMSTTLPPQLRAWAKLVAPW